MGRGYPPRVPENLKIRNLLPKLNLQKNFVYGVVCFVFVFVFFLQDVNILTPSVLMHYFLRMESKILTTLYHLKLMDLKR